MISHVQPTSVDDDDFFFFFFMFFSKKKKKKKKKGEWLNLATSPRSLQSIPG